MQKLTFTSRGLKLKGILERPDPKDPEVLVILHGYASEKNANTYVKIAEDLKLRGKNSFRFDFAGIGESEGKFEEQTVSTMVQDAISAIKALKKEGFKEFSLFGTSAGGLVAIVVASKVPLVKLCLGAPVSNYLPQRIRKYGEAGIAEWKKKGYNYYDAGPRGKFKVNYSFFEDLRNYVDVPSIASKVKCPVLILHGDKDEDVLLSDSECIIKFFSNSQLYVIRGANHKLAVDGDRSEFFKVVCDWLAS